MFMAAKARSMFRRGHRTAGGLRLSATRIWQNNGGKLLRPQLSRPETIYPRLKKEIFIFALLLAIPASFLTACSSLQQPHAAAGSGAFATGNYRNLFAENGHSQKEILARVDSAFQQLFHGDPANQAVYYSAGANSNGPLAFITDIKHNDVRTEGLS